MLKSDCSNEVIFVDLTLLLILGFKSLIKVFYKSNHVEQLLCKNYHTVIHGHQIFVNPKSVDKEILKIVEFYVLINYFIVYQSPIQAFTKI